MSLKDFRLDVLDRLLDLIWSQWTSVGVSGNSPGTGRWIIDPEALVLFTCNIGRYEPRVFDSMLEWLGVHQQFLNVQRLKTLNRKLKFQGGNLLSTIAHLLMKPSSRAKWARLADELAASGGAERPLFYLKDGSPHPRSERADKAFRNKGFIRDEYSNRGKVVRLRTDHPSNLILKLRALFGLSSRCEIIAYLIANSEGNPTEIADVTGYSSKAVYNALSEMYQSGTLHKRVRGKETLYSLMPEVWGALLTPGGSTAGWMNWPMAFRILEKIWAELDNPWFRGEPQIVLESHLKLTLDSVVSDIVECAPEIGRLVDSQPALSRLGYEEIEKLIFDLIDFLC